MDIPKENYRAAAAETLNTDEDQEAKKLQERHDSFVVFSNEKDLRHPESIHIKASLYTGIALRVKLISPQAMENLLYAIDLSSGVIARKKQALLEAREAKEAKENPIKAKKEGQRSSRKELKAEEQKKKALEALENYKPGIVNLRFEECKFSRKAATLFSEWLKTKSFIETICLLKVSFEEVFDFKKITEGIKQNTKLLKMSFQYMTFDDAMHGMSIGRILNDSRSVRELDCSHIVFDYRTFYDMSQAILNDRCRLQVLKLRGLFIGEIEGKIIQFIIMKNKQIHTLDLSECKTEDPTNFDYFIEKMNSFCNIRYLTFEKMQPTLSKNVETLGESLADNTKLEVLILKDNHIKWNHYQAFWSCLMPNRTLQKINLQKTDLVDKVVEQLSMYLQQEKIQLADLDVSKNSITDAGLKILASALMKNHSVIYLNLSQNKIKEDGMSEVVELLKVNTVLAEISFGGNFISDKGVAALAHFLPHNKTLNHLDLSRNSFNDAGFDVFAKKLAFNEGLTFLDIAKNKDITDEKSLVTFCDSLILNKKLKAIDLTGLLIRKPFLKEKFVPALKCNITLQVVIGKMPHNIIESELEQNITIEKDIMPLYIPIFRAGRQTFNLSLVEENQEFHSRLNLKDQPFRLLKAAFKLIRIYDIRSVDFTNAGIEDDTLRILSTYLRSNPNLRSVVLDKNMFTDTALTKLTSELNTNTKLAHLSIRGCNQITNVSLQKLCDIISTTNTCLFQVDLDVEQFDQDLATEVLSESALNRDIQEKLKPIKISTTYDQSGNVVKVVSGADRQELAFQSEEDEQSDNDEEDKEQTEQNAETMGITFTSLNEQGQQNDQQSETTTATINQQVLEKQQKKKDLATKIIPIDESLFKTIVEVKFDGNAKLGDCFKSALKAWRIYSPNVIRAEDQNLNDEHIEELCNFLQKREMISKLNLRRNQISSRGAMCLGKFILEFDETLTHLDVERNRIGQDGGHAILDALNMTTRIVGCQIKYGNPISNKMGRIIEREVKANIQAISYSNMSQDNATKYELIDKGPDFMRCAIKMTQLHNILHLSLPDNMLALEDTRMIADLIKRDTPLRKLNLSANQLDADCAALIANSLIYNKNLRLLDISKNILGDFGVYLLLTPIIRKYLQEQGIVNKQTPTIRDQELIQGKNIKSSKRIFKNITIETKLQYLDLKQNMTTWQVYKQIWLVMIADHHISINIDNPKAMQNRDNSSIFSSFQYQPVPDIEEIKVEQADCMVSPEKAGNQIGLAPVGYGSKVAPADMTVDELSKKDMFITPQKTCDQNSLAIYISDETSLQDVQDSSEELDEEQLIDRERQAMVQEKERLICNQKQKVFERKRKRIICCQKFCCFKDEEQEFDLVDKMPSQTQICCWRFLKARRLSTKFYMGNEALNGLENSKCTACISLLISFNYLILYGNVIVPFILIALADEVVEVNIEGKVIACEDNQSACDLLKEENRVDFNNFVLMVNSGMLIYSMICELVVVCTSLKPTNTSCNSYLLCQLITGFTMRAVILISAQLIAIFIQDLNVVNFALGITLVSTLVLSQFRTVQIWLVSIKKDQNKLLPKIQQNLNICMSTNYLAAATLYQKVCVEASTAAIEQTLAFEAERAQLMAFSFADDDTKISKENKGQNVKAKLVSRCKCCKLGSPKFYQLIMNDVPLIFCLPFAYFFGLMDTVNVAVGMALTLLDLIFMLFYLGYDDELSIDASKVYELNQKRLENREIQNQRIFDDEVSDVEEDDEGLAEGRSSRDDHDLNDNSELDQQLDENLKELHEENKVVLLTEMRADFMDTVNCEGSEPGGTNVMKLAGVQLKNGDELMDAVNENTFTSAIKSTQQENFPPISERFKMLDLSSAHMGNNCDQ